MSTVSLVTGGNRGIGREACRQLAERAACLVWAATLPDSGPTGGFFRDGRPLPW